MGFLIYDSYLAMIKNSVGTKMFRNLYLEKKNQRIDITNRGSLSCAFFVSNILLIFDLISSGHATVEATTKDMKRNGWKRISQKEAKPGDIIIWEKKKDINGRLHLHNGFYIGNKKAISNDSNKGVPIIHNWDYNNKRRIVAIYNYPGFKK
jgi:hypothetical protein